MYIVLLEQKVNEVHNMKKKVVGILICMMLMTMIPGAAGLNYNIDATEETKVIYDDEPETEGLLDKTVIRGVVLFPRSTLGGEFKFFALRIHYTTVYLGGVKKGTVMLRSITLHNIPNGIIGNFYIAGMFRGNLDAYT